MVKKPAKAGQTWAKEDVTKLKSLTKGNTPTGLIAYKLERSEDAVRKKASEESISLKPTNKSPYNRTKKKS